MPRKGFSREQIVGAAVALIEEKGNHAFSLNAVARRVGIQPASLYNHFSGMDELTGEVGLFTARRLKAEQNAAVAGKTGEEALLALCDAYRRFAAEHMGLYKVTMGMQKNKSACTETVTGEIIGPILTVLAGFGLDETAVMHWQRIVRALLHGFVTHLDTGRFSHFPVEPDETYRIAVACLADGIRKSAAGRKEATAR